MLGSEKQFWDRQKLFLGSKTVFGFESNGFWFRKKAAFDVGKIGSGIRKNGVGGSTTGFVVGKKWVCLFGSYIREKKIVLGF